MNLETEVLVRVATLFGVAYILSIFVAHTVEVARKFAPKDGEGKSKLDGWRVPVAALVAAGVITVLILRPSTADSAYDAGAVAVFAALAAVGGDAWIRKVLGRIAGSKSSSSPEWRQEMPTRPDRKGAVPK